MGLVVNKDNTKEILKQLSDAKLKALVKIGLKAQGYAKGLARVDTGHMRAAIGYKVSGDSAYIGTYHIEYAIYNEFGTGKYAENNDGRKTPWYYVDDKGVGHWTWGMKPKPFLRPAAKEHAQEYRDIIEKQLKNG